MKTKVIVSILALLLCGLEVFAQSNNQLSIPVTDGKLGQEVLVPVHMTNSAGITGIQVSIRFPQDAQVKTQGVVLTDRKDDHQIYVRAEGNNSYQFLIFSTSNKLIKGNSGILFHVPVTVPLTWQEGVNYHFEFNQVVLSALNGDNVATGSDPGAIKVTVEPHPDFTVENIVVNKSAVAPGEQFSATWTVKNIGDGASKAGWSERLVLTDEADKQTFLGTLYHEGVINAGGSVSRQAELALSLLPGLEGAVKLSIQIIPDSNAGELQGAQGNNTAKSDQSFTISKHLLLETPANALSESSTSLVQCKLSRSGNWTEAQVFTLTTDDPQRLSVPATVTIPAQQSGAFFYISVINNNVLDIDSIVSISADGNGYATVTQQVVIDDATWPSLSLTASVTEITQGDSIDITLERERITSSELIVGLTCNLTKRLNLPAQVTIPANQKSVVIKISAIDDNLPDMTRELEITASAPKHNPGKLYLDLINNNLPTISLTLTPDAVGKSAGLQAIKATLRRLTHTNNQITVQLSDDSNGRLYYANPRLTLQPGVEEVQFTIGVIDNDQVDGDLLVEVTAAVYVASCSCSITGTNAGSVQASVTILDTNSPALKITSSQPMLPEGKTDATTLTVTRNTPPTAALTVTISSDYDSDLDYVKTVTIPAGSASVEVPVSVLPNTTGIPKGDRTVVFSVTADGYKKGTCWAMISDQTLPDAIVSIIFLSGTEFMAGGKTDFYVVVNNVGAATLPTNVPVNVYLSYSTNVFTTLQTTKALAVDQTDTIRVQNITLPDLAGNFTIHAVVNENQAIKELLFLNNTSEKIPVKLLPKFTATTTTDKTVYKQGEVVIISGQLAGVQTANTAAEVYVICSGVRQTLEAATDASGQFQVTFQPSITQSGHFSVGACYPKEGLTDEQCYFDIYGLKREGSGYITHDLLVDELYNGTIKLSNTGGLALTNVRAVIVSPIDNASVDFSPVSSIAGNATVTMNYTLKGNAPSEGKDWQQIKIQIISDESDLLNVTLYTFFRTPTGKLQADISSIKTTMTKDAMRDYPFTITNAGKGETGKITISLPSAATWLSTATPREMASLASNESATVILRFTPGDELQLNVPISGTIGINCENGTGFPLSFSIEPVSESTGTLVVDVCDEYTYYTTEAPHLAGAKVSVKHPVTNALIAEGVTGQDGLFTVNNLPEGYYSLEVSSEKHDKYKNNILVDPGKVTTKVVNLSFQAITITWNVEETEVEDEYDIITVVNYETNVPVPVVVIEMPEQIPVDELLDKGFYCFNAILTNKGLITALDVQLSFPEEESLLFEYPSMENLTLKPQESIVIPIKISIIEEKKAPQGIGVRAGGSKFPCKIVPVVIVYWECGEDRKWHLNTVTIKMLECKFFNFGEYRPTEPTNPPPPPPLGHSNGYGDFVSWPTLTLADCDPCLQQKGFIIFKCIIDRIPIVSIVVQVIEVMQCVDEIMVDPDGTLECIMWALVPKETFEKVYSWKDIWGNCIKPLFEPCGNSSGGGIGGGGAAGRSISATDRERFAVSLRSATDNTPSYIVRYQESLEQVDNVVEAYYIMSKELFGDEAWLQSDPTELSTFVDQMRNLKGTIISESLLYAYKPTSITDEQFFKFVERWNNKVNKVSSNYIDVEVIKQQALKIKDAEDYSKSLGYSLISEMIVAETNIVLEKIEEANSSVCATISLQFSQTMTMTRQAFRGTLTVFNGHATDAMEDVKLDLVVKDEFGNIATSHEFQINNESLKDFDGALNGDWSLDAQKTGVATIVFIPTKYAALTDSVDYSFGGTLSYTDPFTGLEVTRDLFPVTLTVIPSPNLDLTYFMQRDILGDDPLTPEIEPIVPAEFSLLINNVGAGDANNVRMATQQPKIVDNQKGLFIDFELLSSQLKGGDYTLALGGSIPTDFGNIPAGTTTYAQWWFTGSLLGHFTEYDVTATHVTSYGNPDLTLLNEVTIHELIRSIRTPDGSGSFLTGFVVNDIPDAEDLPDRIYFSDGTIEPVVVTTNIQSVTAGSNQYQLTVTPAATGWNYGAINDPTGGNQQLLEIKRLSDNAIIDLRNFWQTDRTLRDGKDPLYENKLHIIDELGSSNEQYLLTFSPRPNLLLEVESFDGAPQTVSSIPVEEITVRFNKDINVSTFTTDDIQLICQGVAVDISLITITQVDVQTFKLDISQVTGSDGYYVLTVQTADITDYEGFAGLSGKSVNWNQYMGGKMQFNLIIEPAASGTVTPLPGLYNYTEVLNLQATPNTGYVFDRWSINGETQSTNPAYAYTLLSSKTLTAAFKLKLYDVVVNFDVAGGAVTGGGTGKYEHGSSLVLRANPLGGYEFTGWKVDGAFINNLSTLERTVNEDVLIEAVFTAAVVPNMTVTFAGESVTIPPQSVPLGGYVTRPTPDPTRLDYAFDGWYTDNNIFLNVWDFNNYTVTQDTTLYANWAITFGVSIGTFANGDVTANKAAYTQGETVTLTLANIASGYELASIAAHKTNDVTDVPLSGSGKDNGATYTFSMPAYGVTVTATFQEMQSTLDAAAVAAAKTAIQSATFTVAQATANTEALAKTWLATQINALISATGITVSESNITMNAFTAATVSTNGSFDFTVALTKGSASDNAVNSGVILSTPVYTVTMGSMTNGGVSADKTSASQGETVTLTITPATDYELDAISANKTGDPLTTVTLSGTDNNRTFTMPDYDVTVVATFKKAQATLDAESVAAAKTTVEGGTYTVAQATANTEALVKTWLVTQINNAILSTGITLTESDITFSAFTAAANGADGSFDFTIALTKGSATATASKSGNTISATPVFTVTIGVFANGSVVADRMSALPGETVTLTVTPDAGYELDAISAYKTGEPATTITLTVAGADRTFTMPAYDVTVTATFKKTQATLDAEAVATAKTTIEGNAYTVAQTVANTEADVKTWLTAQLNTLITLTGITLTSSDITISTFTAANSGVNGSFNFSVALTKGVATGTAAKSGNTISATPVYTVTVGVSTNGSVIADRMSALPGETVTLTITPDADYELDAITAFKTGEQTISITLAGTGATRTFDMPAYGVTIAATFKKTQATLDAEAVATAKTAIESRTYTVAQATANTETAVRTWLAAQINDLITATTGISVTAANITLNNFTAASSGVDGGFDFVVALEKGTVNDTAAKNGNTISAAAVYSITIGMMTGGSVTTNATTAVSGATITLTITPDAGYELSGDISVYETGNTSNTVTFSGTGATRTFQMPAHDVTVTATFVKTQVTLDAEAVTAAQNAVENATYIVAQATANDDASVKTWLTVQINALITPFNIDPVTDSDINLGGSLTAASNGVDGSFDFTVSLFKGSAIATATKTGNTITASPVFTVSVGASTNGSVSADKMSAIQGETVTLTITPDTGYELDALTAHKTGDPSTTVTISGATNTRTFTMPDYDVTVTATFKKTQATLDAEAVAAAKNAIESATFTVAQVTANTESTVKVWLVSQINALISTGLTVTEADLTLSNFIAAAGGVNGSFDLTVALAKGSATGTATCNGNTITATAIPVYTVTVNSTTNGSVVADRMSALPGETITLTVTPDAGYELITISVYKSDDPSTMVTHTVSGGNSTFTMPAYNVTVTATFAKTQATLDDEAVAAAKDAIENASFTVSIVTANTEAAVKSWLVSQINSLIASTGLIVTEADLTFGSFTAAIGGANGSFDLSVTLTKGGASATAITNGAITTTPVYAVIVGTSTNGSVTADRTSSITQGETVTLTITPANGYELETITAHKTGEPATIVSLSGTGNTRTFAMPDYDVTVTATFTKKQETLDAEAVATVQASIEGGVYRIAQATANDAASVKNWLINTLKVLFGQSYDIQLRSGSQPIIGDITVTAVTPAIAGTESSPNGTDGSFSFTVALTCGATSLSTTATDGVIIAIPHSSTPVRRIELLPINELTIRILNTGNVATGDLTVSLTGPNANVFDLSASTTASLAAGDETDIVLIPRYNLQTGTYKAIFTVSGTGLTEQSIGITYTVTITDSDVLQPKALTVYIHNETMYVNGLVAGEMWSVYNITGVLIHQEIAKDRNAKIILPVRGLYLVISGNQAVKALY